jgi:hypothetical protein
MAMHTRKLHSTPRKNAWLKVSDVLAIARPTGALVGPNNPVCATMNT